MGEEQAQPEADLDLLAHPTHRIFLALAHSGCGTAWSFLVYLWLYNLGGGKPVSWPNMTMFSRLFDCKAGIARRKIYRALSDLRDAGLIDYRGTEDVRKIEFIIPEQVPLQTLADYAIFLKEHRFATPLPLNDNPRKSSRKPKTDTPATDSNPGENNIIPSEDTSPTEPAAPSQTTPKVRLTPEDRMKICGSLDQMCNYLLWGKPGLYEPDKTNKPSNLNWRQFREGEGDDEAAIGVTKWNVNHFMGYFWYNVSRFRAARGLELTLPNFQRLAGEIKNLLSTGTNWRTFNYLGMLAVQFDVLCCIAGNHCKDLLPDETLIHHAQIKNAVNAWLNAGDAQRAQWAQDYMPQVEARELRLYGKNVYYVKNQSN